MRDLIEVFTIGLVLFMFEVIVGLITLKIKKGVE